MEDYCLKRDWSEFDQNIKGKKIYLFGGASGAKMFFEKYGNKYRIEAIIDNDKAKHGTLFEENYMILGIDEIKNENKDNITILISSTYYSQIFEQLFRLGFEHIFSFLHLEGLQHFEINDWKIKPEDLYKIIKVRDILEDEKSKFILNQIVEKRNMLNHDYSDLFEENQYFERDIIKLNNEEIFVDAGAYDGDTIKKFLEEVEGEYCKIYAFEPDVANYEKLNIFSKMDKIIVYNYGVWNKKEEISFVSGEESSKIAEKGNGIIECCKLDDIINDKITFLKMDIEGAEIKALEGARNLIKKYKPKMAICVYHEPNHLWEIPLYIKGLVPEYKFYLRHYGKAQFETVIYAV